jgi:hypothetical protein
MLVQEYEILVEEVAKREKKRLREEAKNFEVLS